MRMNSIKTIELGETAHRRYGSWQKMREAIGQGDPGKAPTTMREKKSGKVKTAADTQSVRS